MNYENPFERPLTGQQIKDWIWHHSHTLTSYTSLAKRMSFCFNLEDETVYELTLVDDVPIVKKKES